MRNSGTGKTLVLAIALLLFFSALSFGQSKPFPFGINLAGAEFAHDEIPGVYGKNYIYPTTEELDYFKSKSLLLVRLPFSWERIQPQLKGELDKTELERMRSVVNAAAARGMHVILDMHNYCRRYVNGTRYIIGAPEVSIEDVSDAWVRLAREFKGQDCIWGYGIMNEPHDLLESTPWFNIAQDIITKIRTVDTKTSILIAGDSWSSAERWPAFSGNLKDLVDPSRNLIFEGHIYFDDDASGSYRESYDKEQASAVTGIMRAMPFVEWLKKNNFRGFIGEYGVPDDDPRWLETLDKLLSYLKKNGLNGAYWAAGPMWGKYRLAVEPKDGVDRPQMKVLEKYKIADEPAHK